MTEILQTLWHNVYKQLAENINNAIESPPRASEYIYNAFLIILNLNSSGDGILISNTFLDILNKLYIESFKIIYLEPHIKVFVRQVNDFTIRTEGNLTTFINSIAYWDEGCIPIYWTQYSEELGYDTSEWNSCS